MTFIETLYGGKNNLGKFVVTPKRQLPPVPTMHTRWGQPPSQIDRIKFRQLQDIMLIKLLSGGK